VANLIRSVTNERLLSDEQFRDIAAFADAPQPVPARIDREEFARLMAVTSATLKLRPSADGEGEIKLGVFFRVLGDVPAHNLRRAFNQALRECEWFPTPAALLKMAEGHTAEEITLHQRARFLARERRQRIGEDILGRIEKHEADLADAPARLIDIAIARGWVFRKRDGTAAYRTAENLAADAPPARTDAEEQAA
jgi:hypothetical protein